MTFIKGEPKTKEKILNFISLIRTAETVKIFTMGKCYNFAKALFMAFSDLNPVIIGLSEINKESDRKFIQRMIHRLNLGHFVCEIESSLYDITGNAENSDIIGMKNSTPIVLKSRKERLEFELDLFRLSDEEFEKKYPLKEGTDKWFLKYYLSTQAEINEVEECKRSRNAL